MTDRRTSRHLALACALVAFALPHTASAAYEPPLPAYAPPTTYYNAATSSVAATLKGQLQSIVNAGVTNRSYDSADEAMPLLDRDPTNASRIVLIYNRALVSNVWDSGNTWNKEHQWPNSQLSSAANGDLFNLRPANPSINSNRGSQPFGPANSTGGYFDGPTYFFPGDADKGDVARSLFYVATRFPDHTLVNGTATGFQQMGDLQALLKYHYTDGVDNFERRRNQYIYGSSGNSTSHDLNPQYYQGNRNPYIDRPEYVWAVFGGGSNNSQISVGGATPAADGSSSVTLDLGRVIKGAAIPTGSVTVNKAGAHPTTFDATATGVTTAPASQIPLGTGQPFDYDNVIRTMSLALSASSAAVGVKSGTVILNNTDLTTGGAGRGSQDGNDTIHVTATVVDHANASFSLAADANSHTLDFGYVPQGFAPRTAPFAIANLPAPSGFTAGLALKSVSINGSNAFSENVTTFSNIPAGAQDTYAATLQTASPGTLAATRSYSTSDEAIPGASSAGVLNLTLTARVLSEASFPATGTLDLLAGEIYATGPFSVAAGVALTKTGPGTLHVTGPQSNGPASALLLHGGHTTLSTDASPSLSISAAGGTTTLAFTSPQHLASLTLTDGATADLADHPLTLAAIPASDVRSYLAAQQLLSSTPDPDDTRSLGYLPADASTHIQLTLTGDANLDGLLTPDDYTLLDRGLATSGQYWWQGDFNYDGAIDQLDYLLIDRTAGLRSGTLSPALLADREARFGPAYVATLAAAVPEPASLASVTSVITFAVARRRR
jgi:endonuclease I